MTGLLLGLVLAAVAEPQDQEITLKECVHSALKNNLELEVARYDPWIQHESLLGNFGIYDTLLFAKMNLVTTESLSTTILSGVLAGDFEQTQGEYSIGLRQRLPFGGLVELSTTAQSNQSNSIFASLNPSWKDSIGLSVTLPILRDSGSDMFQSLLRIQHRRRDSSIDQFEIALTAQIHAVQRGYFELIFARESRAMAARTLDLAKRLVQDNEKKLAQAQIPKIQLTEAQAHVASEEQRLIRAEQAYQNALDAMRRLIDPSALRSSTPREYVPTDTPKDPEQNVDEAKLLDESVAGAMQRRADLRQAERQIQISEWIASRARNAALPKLDFFVRGSLLGVDDTVEGAYSRIFRLGDFEAALGFTFEAPISNTTLQHEAARAELERRRAVISKRDLESRILLEIRQAVRDIKTQERSLKSAREQVRLAEDRFKAETARYDQGLSTTYFVSAARADWSAALLNQIRARIDHTIAWTTLKRATGVLLDEFQIEVGRELLPRQP